MPTLETIHVKIKKLQAQAEAIAVREAAHALDRIRDIVEKHGLSITDIEAHLNGRKHRVKSVKGTGNKSVKPVGSKGKLPPKYRDPKTGATWSGRARPPAWIANVKDRSKFLIAVAADGTGVAGKSRQTGKKVATGKAATRPVKAAATSAAKKSTAKKAVVKHTVKTRGATTRKVAGKKVSSGTKTAALAKRPVAAKKTSAGAAGTAAPKTAIADVAA